MQIPVESLETSLLSQITPATLDKNMYGRHMDITSASSSGNLKSAGCLQPQLGFTWSTADLFLLAVAGTGTLAEKGAQVANGTDSNHTCSNHTLLQPAHLNWEASEVFLHIHVQQTGQQPDACGLYLLS